MTEFRPLVSVLIPVFNGENHLKECVESAVRQTYRPLEIIVSDNASTDGTWNLCRALADQYTEVRISQNNENIGPVRNWQRCVELAQGSFGKFLYADDLLAPNYISETIHYLDDPEIGFVFTAGAGGFSPDDTMPYHEWRPGISSSRQFILERGNERDESRLPVSPVAAIFRMSDLRKNIVLEFRHSTLQGMDRHGAGPDLLTYLLTAEAYPKVAHVPEPLAFFRARKNSLTAQHGRGALEIFYELAAVDVLFEQFGNATAAEMLSRMWIREIIRNRRWTSFREFIAKRELTFPVESCYSCCLRETGRESLKWAATTWMKCVLRLRSLLGVRPMRPWTGMLESTGA